MMMTKGIVLGHFISIIGIHVYLTRIEVIIEIPTPWTQTEVRSFLGYVGCYHCFIVIFSKIAAPLSVMTRPVEFEWTYKCDTAFVDLKRMISTGPVFQGQN